MNPFKAVKIRDTQNGNKIVAEMPLFVWRIIGKIGLCGGYILNSFMWDYASLKDGGIKQHWTASLLSGIRLYAICKGSKNYD